ncbi:MAG: serine/threonine-protein phosphatase, partial [Planctomycetes bacterium]|nr:serine/threonine-protein phosphatase [Planctomycetota bacterium]
MMAEPLADIAFDCAFATEKGTRARKVVNEDSVCAHIRGGTLPAHTDATAVLAVADGMGGGIAGDEASRLVVARLAERFAARPYNALAGELGLDGSDPRLVVRYVVDAIHRELYQLAVSSGRHMGSTLDALVVHGNRFLLGHVGDSRTYLIRSGTIVLRTEPHSAKEALGGSEHASVVLNMLGTSHSVTVESFIGDVELGDCFVLCSDGICGDGLVTDAEVLAILRKVRKLSHACRGLIMLAQQRGSTDDLSV